ncbi:ankyrin repeat domain-containing protein [Spirillospora sp. CA-255316]
MIDHRTQELADWQRVRRYAVPRWMIERATGRRLAGDWQGACAAALVRVGFDLDGIAREHGAEVAGAVLDDLRHLAPDLVRWHLPRLGHGRSTLVTHLTVVLAEYGDGRSLHVVTPTMADGPQHLRLGFGRVEMPDDYYRGSVQSWATARHLWDARRSGELLERCGGDARAPFFHPDGTPLGAGELRGPGPAGLAERVIMLQESGEIEAAFDAAGLDLDPKAPELPSYYRSRTPREILATLPLALHRLAAEIRLQAASAADPGEPYQIPSGWPTTVLVVPKDRPWVRVEQASSHGPSALPDALWRRLPDLDLLRAGRITLEELHPLVRSALFPARPEADGAAGPPGPRLPGPVRVRCRGDWHEVQLRDGGLRIPHTDEEQQRESALHALGGATAGCFAVKHAWNGQGGRLPRQLRAQRQELFARVQHGDTLGVLRLLDAGVDPHARDGRKRTLLHMLHMLDHEELLPRLLQAGLDLEAKDQNNRTPLHMAVGDHGSEALVRALVDAGARIDVVDDLEWSLSDLIKRIRRTDLGWLTERLEAECPGLGGRWWDYDEE